MQHDILDSSQHISTKAYIGIVHEERRVLSTGVDRDVVTVVKFVLFNGC